MKKNVRFAIFCFSFLLLVFGFNTMGQGLETFDNLDLTGTSYQNGTFTGQDGSTWTFYQCRGDVPITGKAIMIGRNRTPQSNFYSGTISGGIGVLNFDYMQAFSTNVNLNILINDVVVGNVKSLNEENLIKNSGDIVINVPGDFVIKFINANNSDGQVVVDNISWTAFDEQGNQVVAPVITPSGGIFYQPVEVSISTQTEGASIYYTLDGTDPDASATLYTGAFTISSTTTVKAIGIKDGMDNSSVVTATFTFPAIIDVSTIADLRAGLTDGTVYRLTGEALITAMDGFNNRKFIEDATAAIMIFDSPGIIETDYNVGDKIRNVTGTLSVANNMLRFVPVLDPGTAVSTGNPVVPTVFSIDGLTSADQAKLVTLKNVSFTSTGTFANGQNYTITDGTNNFVLRTDFYNVDYIGKPIPTTVQNITGVIIQFNTVLQIVPRNLADFAVVEQFARAQIIHNSADPAAANVDVFVNGTLAIPDFAFRTATKFIELPAEVELTIDIAPAGAGIAESVGEFKVTLDKDQTYVIVANGLIPADKDPVSTEFNLFKFAPAREQAEVATNTDILVFHGSTDAPEVSVWAMGGENELFTFSYGQFSGYLPVATTDLVLEVRTADGSQVVAAYQAPLATLELEGEAITVLASGFLTPQEGQAAFGLYVATAEGGELLPLPVYKEEVVLDLPFFEDFQGYGSHENFVLTSGWRRIDADGDGYNWYLYYHTSTENWVMVSESWVGGGVGAVTPTNYLITPALRLPEAEANKNIMLSFKVAASGNNYFLEKYKVLLSKTGTEIADFTEELWVETLTENEKGWNLSFRSINLNAYAGEIVYIAFVHTECTDQDRLVIDDVGVKVLDVTSVPQITEAQFKVFPNPARTVLNVVSDTMIREVRLIDMLGQVVYAANILGESHQINVASLRNGIYFVQILTPRGVETRKIQVQH